MECPFSASAELLPEIMSCNLKTTILVYMCSFSLCIPVTKRCLGFEISVTDIATENVWLRFFPPLTALQPLQTWPRCRLLTHAVLFLCPKYITMHLTKSQLCFFFKMWMSCRSLPLVSFWWFRDRKTYLNNKKKHCAPSLNNHIGDTGTSKAWPDHCNTGQPPSYGVFYIIDTSTSWHAWDASC